MQRYKTSILGVTKAHLSTDDPRARSPMRTLGSIGIALVFALAAVTAAGCTGAIGGAAGDDTSPDPTVDAGPSVDAAEVCESDILCGDTEECCTVGDLCLSDQCVTPGAACTEALDCEIEEYCDTGLDRCLPRGPDHCEYYPPTTVFSPEQQWAWTGSAVAPASVNVMMTPVVGDLDGDGTPEVAFATYNASEGYTGSGVLRVVRGDTGAELFSIESPVVCPESGIALGDLDGDGSPEIVTTGPCGGPVLAFNNDGSLKWSSHNADDTVYNTAMSFGAPSLADLEGDGRVEIVLGGAVIEHDGTVRWTNGLAALNCCGDPVSAIYDVDADGALEIVAGNTVWEADGTVLWNRQDLEDGYVAVGDFFADDIPDVVVVHNGSISIRRGTDGEPLWGPVAQPGGGRGGPPTVADFDGDGLPEIGVAGAASYSVYDPDGPSPVLWSQTTQDTSSNITGSSVFDFDGDGRAEVVYNDECYMRVYAGTDGTVLAQVAQNSHTLIEYPLIVDVDADGNAEIVFAGNAAVNRCSAIPGYPGLQAGVRVWRDSTDNWVGTRPVWNQHTYHITNIRQDLSLPDAERPNWRRSNNFRTNAQSFDAPNLVPLEPAVTGTGCTGGEFLRMRVTVENRGAVSVAPGLAVSFYIGTPDAPIRLVDTGYTTQALLPGASTTVDVPFSPEPDELGETLDWFARADDVGEAVGQHNECVEEDNEVASTLVCDVID